MSYDNACPDCGAHNAANRDCCWQCNAPFVNPGDLVGGVAESTQGGPVLNAGPLATSVSGRIATRYRDAYRVGMALVALSDVIKAVGGVIAAIVAFMGLSSGGVVALAGLAIGVIGGGLFWLLGVVVAAQGQILTATLDSAVSNSPFLTDDERLKAMGIGSGPPPSKTLLLTDDERLQAMGIGSGQRDP